MKRRITESVKRYPIRFREDIGPYITLGGRKYPLDDSKYDPRLSANEVIDKFDKEYKADEADKAEKKRKEDIKKRTKSIVDKNKKILSGKSSYDDKFSALFHEYVPSSGKADTLGGEILRAANKIEYRWYNDGDVFFAGYGKETSGVPAAFLYNIYDSEHEYLEDLSSLPVDFADEICKNDDKFYSPGSLDEYMDKEYPKFLDKLIKLSVNVVIDHPELFLENTEDMYDTEVSDMLFEEPKFDYSIEYPYDLQKYLDSDIITTRNIDDYVNDTLSWYNNFKYDEYYCGSYSLDIIGLDYDSFMTIDQENGKDEFFDSYIEDLKSEFGDPDDLEEDEEEIEEEDEE